MTTMATKFQHGAGKSRSYKNIVHSATQRFR